MQSSNRTSHLQLEINFSDWDEDISELNTPGLAEEIINILLNQQKIMVTKINRYLARPSESSSYKSAPGLIDDAITMIHNFCAKVFPTLANNRDKITLQIIQRDLLNKYIELIEKSGRMSEKKTKPVHLYQQLQGADKEISFKSLLRTIAAKNNNYDPKCSLFISYAWPTDANKKAESWVQPFLHGLKDHLELAGISVTLDNDDNFLGNSIISFIQKIVKSDYVVLIGTPSLLDKHNLGTHIICVELNMLKKKRQKDLEKGLYNVLPILLQGEFDSAFPIEYQYYTTIRDWRTKSYLFNLKKLISRLYGIGEKNNEYAMLWRDFAEEMKNEHVDWVHDILNRPYQENAPVVHESDTTDSLCSPLEYQTPKDIPPLGSIIVNQAFIEVENLHQQTQMLLQQLLQESQAHTLARLYLYADPNSEEMSQAENRVAQFEWAEADNQDLLRRLQTGADEQNSISSSPRQHLLMRLEEQSQLLQIGLKAALALLCYKQRHYREAAKELADFMKQIDGVHSYLLAPKVKLHLLTNTYNLIAKIFRSTGRYAQAIRAYDKALALIPDDAILLSSKAALLNDSGKYTKNYSQHIEAMKYHRLAEQLIIRTVESPQRKSIVLGNLGRGLQQLVEAKQIPPQQFSDTLNEAVNVLNQAINLNPENLTAYLFRGIIYMDPAFSEPPLLEQALIDFNYVLAKQPEHPTALRRKAMVLIQQHQLPAAKELFDRAYHYVECRDWIPEGKIWLEEIRLAQRDLKSRFNIDRTSQKQPVQGSLIGMRTSFFERVSETMPTIQTKNEKSSSPSKQL